MAWTFRMVVLTSLVMVGCSGAEGDPAPLAPEGGADGGTPVPCVNVAPDDGGFASSTTGDATTDNGGATADAGDGG